MANEMKAPTAKHTAGPWTFIVDPDGKFGVYPSEPRGKFLAITDTEANARLIAAAPEMLEAIVEWHRDWDDRYDGQPLKDWEVKMLAIVDKLKLKGDRRWRCLLISMTPSGESSRTSNRY